MQALRLHSDRCCTRNRHYENWRRIQPTCAGDFCDESSIVIRQEEQQTVSIEVSETKQAIDWMGADFRDVLEMVAIQGHSFEEAAKAHNLPVGTVRSRLSRARANPRGTAESGTDSPDRPFQ